MAQTFRRCDSLQKKGTLEEGFPEKEGSPGVSGPGAWTAEGRGGSVPPAQPRDVCGLSDLHMLLESQLEHRVLLLLTGQRPRSRQSCSCALRAVRHAVNYVTEVFLQP